MGVFVLWQEAPKAFGVPVPVAAAAP